jgi:hypothetical protein
MSPKQSKKTKEHKSNVKSKKQENYERYDDSENLDVILDENSDENLDENSDSRKRSLHNHECKNPIDNLAISTSEYMSTFFERMNYSPNGLTIISIIFGTAAMYHLYRKELFMFSIYAVLSYLFNRTDDVYAKKYGFTKDMVDDRYGRFKDLLTLVVGIYILYNRYDLGSHNVLMIVLCAFFVLSIISVGCEKRVCTQFNDKGIIDKTIKYVTPSESTCSKYINYTKYFGPGILIILLIGSAWYLKSIDKNDTNTSLYQNQFVGVDPSQTFRPFDYSSLNPELLWNTNNTTTSYRF